MSRLTNREWDVLVRAARSARLLVHLGDRLDAVGLHDSVPAIVRNAITSDRIAAAYRHQMATWELERIAVALAPLDIPLVLLKGAAYMQEGFEWSRSRTISDVDILVPRSRIDEAERQLKERGWFSESLDAYDDRYYRAWSHEIPPLRYPGCAVELDLHHAIVPPGSRVASDVDLLFESSRPSRDARFRVLSPQDMILHACLHLFFDADCTNRLRDLVDLDGLLKASAATGAWERLLERAIVLGAERPLWYGLHFAHELLDTEIPDKARRSLDAFAPPRAVERLMSYMVQLSLPPPHPDHRYSRAARISSSLLRLRSSWLRFPSVVFFQHLAYKPLRRLGESVRLRLST